MNRKKLDNRIRILIENGINTGHRGFVMLLGEQAREQVVILHHMLRKATVKSQPKVLWCYKKELDFADSRNKRRKKLSKKIQQGKLNPETEDPFDQFIASTEIRFCYYKDTHKILGNTFGMCVLQDFEALTPNLLARTIETVEGGGLVVLLLNSVKSRRALFTLSMDVHSRYRTEAHHQIIPRFNERFILSLSNNKRSILLDDNLNVIPHSSHIKALAPISRPEESSSLMELKQIKSSLQDTQPAGSLVNLCLTIDQAKGLIRFIDAIAEKTLKRTVSLTAARGRGKSAALGLAMAAAVGFGYSNIFVTSPSPENLGTLFDFIFKGFDAMGYEEHTDYELIKSTNPEFSNAVVRVNVFRDHRQTIQYIHPKDSHRLGQAELMVIDEAAAIPLPLVKALLGPYLVFMASTINGYEGTGRSLSLKLLEQLRKQSSSSQGEVSSLGRTLTEVTLDESIRYSKGDPTESWLNRLLCLDSTVVPPLSTGCPLPADCELFYVNRDTLFSFNDVTEAFLQRIMAMFVAAHYKNSPNDLQMLSDAPAHHLFVLLGPKISGNALPEVFSVIQVCLEGEISKASIMDGLSQGKRPHGDLIPWSMATQYQDDNFPSLSGVRIVRIATHPDYQRMGYGKRAMELLQCYYENKFIDLNESSKHLSSKDNGTINTVTEEDVSLTEEVIKPRKNLPPLFYKLSERPAEKLDYLGVSFGLTKDLLKFWKRVGFTPTYLRQTKNDLTGEHSMIMLKTLEKDASWLREFWSDFRRRISNLVGLKSMDFHPELLISLLENQNQNDESSKRELTVTDLDNFVTPYDMKRLELYSKNMADYHLIVDLLPNIARLFFLYKIDGLRLSAMQKVILAGMGLQNKTVDDLVTDLELVGTQIMGLFNKMIRKCTSALNEIREKNLTQSMLSSNKTSGRLSAMKPIEESMDVELENAAKELKHAQKEQLDALKQTDIGQYAIKGSDKEWESALSGKGSKNMISVKSGEKRVLKASNLDVDSLVESLKPKKKKKKTK